MSIRIACTRLLAPTALATALCVGSLACGTAKRTEGPNVLLISIDTLRPDHLGCYGYNRETSPSLDALAASGTLFGDVMAPAPWTLPSHASLLTGRYPSRHGVLEDSHRLSAEVPSIATILSRAGYATRAIVNANYLAAKYGLDQGFEEGYELVKPHPMMGKHHGDVSRWPVWNGGSDPLFLETLGTESRVGIDRDDEVKVCTPVPSHSWIVVDELHATPDPRCSDVAPLAELLEGLLEGLDLSFKVVCFTGGERAEVELGFSVRFEEEYGPCCILSRVLRCAVLCARPAEARLVAEEASFDAALNRVTVEDGHLSAIADATGQGVARGPVVLR